MFKLLTAKTNTIGKTALLLTFFTIFSSALAVVRDKIFSSQFGAGEVLDTYIAAFKIPDLLFLLTATLISAFVIIPFLEREGKKGQKYLQLFTDKLFFTFALFISLISVVVFFTMPTIANILFSDFSKTQLENLVHISRIMLLSPIFMGLSFTFSAINQKNGYFFPMAMTGVFYNISIIFGALVLYPFFGFDGVVFGVVFGAFLYLLLQIPAVIKEKQFPKKINFFNIKEFFEIFKISAPRSVALVLSDLLLIFMIAIAAKVGTGSVTILNFAINIFMVPIGVIAVSYSVATFPKLAKSFSEGNIEKVKEISRDVISRILFFGIPISFFFISFSFPLVGLLLGSEKFGLEEIFLTSLIVSVLSLAIVFQAISIMTVRIFYAMGKTWLPLLANIFTAIILVATIFLTKDFFSGLKIYSPFREYLENGSTAAPDFSLEILAIPLAYILAFIAGAFITNFFFHKSISDFPLLKGSSLGKKIIISMISIFFAKTLYYFLLPSLENSFWVFFVNLVTAGFLFLIIFVALYELFPDKNYTELRKKIIHIFLKIFTSSR